MSAACATAIRNHHLTLAAPPTSPKFVRHHPVLAALSRFQPSDPAHHVDSFLVPAVRRHADDHAVVLAAYVGHARNLKEASAAQSVLFSPLSSDLSMGYLGKTLAIHGKWGEGAAACRDIEFQRRPRDPRPSFSSPERCCSGRERWADQLGERADRHKEAELNMGENNCIDRCVSKYWQV